MTQRGAFIVIEGLDRSGKTTQAKLLLDYLQRKTNAKLIKFPGNSNLSMEVLLSFY